MKNVEGDNRLHGVVFPDTWGWEVLIFKNRQKPKKQSSYQKKETQKKLMFYFFYLFSIFENTPKISRFKILWERGK